MQSKGKDDLKRELYEAAKKVAQHSYSPYSKFKVGAAVKTINGKVFCGTNVENVSYGLTICAERVAICKAISKGEKEINDSSSRERCFCGCR